MSNRFPDFDITRTPALGLIRFASSECTEAARARCFRAIESSPSVRGRTGQDLWLKARAIVLDLVAQGEIVRVGLEWDVP